MEKAWVVDIRWDWALSKCVVICAKRDTAIRKAQRRYPAYEILDAIPYTLIK